MPSEPHHPERIFYYFCVHLKLVPQPAFVLDISSFWDQKLTALKCYHSQFIEGYRAQPRSFLDGLRDEFAYWGRSIGTAYAEPFATREPVGVTSMRDFV